MAVSVFSDGFSFCERIEFCCPHKSCEIACFFLNWLIAVQIVLYTICHLSHMTFKFTPFSDSLLGSILPSCDHWYVFFHFWNKNWRPKGLLKYGRAPSAWGGGRDISPFTLSDNFGYLETVLAHPVMRHIFANTVQLNWTPEYLVKLV